MFDIVEMKFRLELLVIVLAFTFCNSLFATIVNLHTSKKVSLIINMFYYRRFYISNC